MTKTLPIHKINYSIFLKDDFFDSKDTSYNTKISMYLDLIQIYGFRASQISMDLKIVNSVNKEKHFIDLLVYDNNLQPKIIIKIKSPEQYNEYISRKFTTNLFDIAKFSKGTIEYLVLVYSNQSGYIDQKDIVVVDYNKYKSFLDWEKSKFKHTDFIPFSNL